MAAAAIMKITKIAISAMATPILIKFGTVMQNGSPNRTYL